jgi:hypothetical protein
MAAAPAAAGLPAGWATFATGAAGGGGGAGITAYLRSRARGESEEQALKAAALATAVAAPSGGFGAYAGSAAGPLGTTAAGAIAGGASDLAGQGIEWGLGLREGVDLLEALLATLAGGAGSRMTPRSSSSELDPMNPLGLRDGLPLPSQGTTPGAGASTIEPKTTGPASSGGSGSKPEVLARSKLEHQNASIGELQGYWRAQARGEIGILDPGPTTSPGRPDYITLDLNKREIVVYDSKYRGPGGSYPSGVPPSKLQSWLPQVRKAIEAMPNGPMKTRALQALQQGKIRGEVSKWPQ